MSAATAPGSASRRRSRRSRRPTTRRTTPSCGNTSRVSPRAETGVLWVAHRVRETTMKAAVVTENGVQYKDAPKPSPKANEILIKVKAASLNRADLAVDRKSVV